MTEQYYQVNKTEHSGEQPSLGCFSFIILFIIRRKREKTGMRKYTFISFVLAALMIMFGGCGQEQTGKETDTKGEKWEMGQIQKEDFLKVENKKIVNTKGEGIVLRGTNAGGWLVQEFWMCPTEETENVSCQKELIETLTERFGKEKAEELIDIYEENYWTETDFDNCKEMGMNVIRLPFTYMNFLEENGTLKEEAFEKTDWFVNQAGKRGLYVILDMHGAQGSQNEKDHSGDTTQGAAFFYGKNAKANQKAYVELWKKIANRYKGNPTVAGYDLLNEPYCDLPENTGKTCWDIYDRTYQAIRRIDAEHIIIMEAKWNPENLPDPDTYQWENIMYEYHQYNYGDQNTPQAQFEGIELKLDLIDSADYNVANLIGETSFFSNMESWKLCLNEMNRRKCSYTTWTYKVTGTGNNNWGIYNTMGEKVNAEQDSYEEIKEKWSNQQNVIENQQVKKILEKYYTGYYEK